MAETKAERRAAWKSKTTKTATALRKAGATVSLGGKRSIPTTARTPAEIRVAAYRAEHPERVVVDPVTGKHTRIDTRTGAATVISRAPSAITDISMQDTRTIEARMAGSQRLAAERERASMGAALVAEARARPPDIAEPEPYVGPEYVPSPYRPGTRPEDVEYGEPEVRRRMEPQITTIHETIGEIIDVSAMKFRTGAAIGEGKPTPEDIKDITPVKEPEKYVTRDIHDFITEKTEDYRRAMESKPTQEFLRGVAVVPTLGLSTQIPAESKWAPERLLTGALRMPVSVVDIAASLPVGAEHMIRTKGEVFKDMPLAAGVMIGGMKHEAMTDPLAFTGEMIALPVVSKFAPPIHIKVPAGHVLPIPPFIPKTKMPKGLTPEQQLKFQAGMDIATSLEKVDAPIMKGLEFTEIKALPGKSGELVESWIRENPGQDPIIGGSTAATAHFKGARRPGDVDLYVKDPIISAKQISKLLEKDLGKENVRVVIKEQFRSAVVETKVKGEWHHAVDVNPSVPAGSQLRFGMETQKPVTIEGIKYVRPGELIQRKAESILQERAMGKIGPRPHRGKDIADFIEFTQEIITEKQKAAETATFFKGRKTKKAEALEEQLKTYGMYSVGAPYPIIKAAAWYEKLPLPTRTALTAIAVGVREAQYPTPKIPKKKIVKPYPIPDIKKPPRIETVIPPYEVPTLPDTYPTPVPPIPEPYPKPIRFVPPYKVPPVPDIYPTPITPPPVRKPKKLRLDEKRKKPGVIKDKRAAPGYAWDLANPIASLEQLMGGGRQAPRTSKKKSNTSRRRK